jgi:hypothetical protein
MRVSVEESGAAVVEFESDDELDAEYASNLAAGGLFLPTTASLAEFTPLELTIRLDGGGETTVRATVVRRLPSGIAVAIEGAPEAIVAALRPQQTEREGTTWDRVRALTRNEKLLLAPKAERSERQLLAQENDPQVLYALLRNPRITSEEVSRIAKSPYLSAQAADLIAKTPQWTSLDVRLALVHNPRTPTPLALKILPTLPEREIRQIAKATAVSQPLKQAALRIVVNRP